VYKAYNGEVLWEGEEHGKEEDMASAYMAISHIINMKRHGMVDFTLCIRMF